MSTVRSFLQIAWRGFVRLFGLNACATPPAGRALAPEARATRDRIRGLLRRR